MREQVRMNRRAASKRNLQIFKCIAFNILPALLLCTGSVSCGGDENSTPDSSVIFQAAGEAYRSGDLVTAGELLADVIEMDPCNPNVWRNLGTVSLDMGHYDEAVSAYEKVIELDSTRVDVLTDITAALLGAGRIEEALHTGELSTRLTPEDGISFNNYGMVLMEARRYEEAAMCFNTALRREPDNASVLYNCGRITLMSGNYEDALYLFLESLNNDPGFLAVQIEAARTLGILERYAEAEEMILAVLAVTPSNPEALNILALACSSQNRQEEAIEVLELLLIDYPGDLSSRLGLAECLYLQGDLTGALDNYKIFMDGLADTLGTSGIRLRITELEAICDET